MTKRILTLLVALFLCSTSVQAQTKAADGICDGDYRADCMYTYLVNYGLNYKPDFNNQRYRQLIRIGDLLLQGGQPETARLLTLRALAEMHEIMLVMDRPKTDTETILLQLEKIGMAEKNPQGAGGRTPEYSPVDDINDIELKKTRLAGLKDIDAQTETQIAEARKLEKASERLWKTYTVAELLENAAVQHAGAGNFDKALSYARRIGDENFNTSFLLFPPQGKENRDFEAAMTWVEKFTGVHERYGQGMNVLITYLEAANELAVQRFAKEGEKPARKYLAEVNKVFARGGEMHRPEPPDMAVHWRMRSLDILAAPEKDVLLQDRIEGSMSPLTIRYPAVAGNMQGAWGGYEYWAKQGFAYEMLVAGLLDIAASYALRPDAEGRGRTLAEIAKLTQENLPSCEERALAFGHCKRLETGGPVLMTHKYGMQVLALLKARAEIEALAKAAEAYKDPVLKNRTALYAATALAAMGETKAAEAHAEKFMTYYRTKPTEPQLQRRDRDGLQTRTSAEEDIADFILTVAKSAAPAETKRRVLAYASELRQESDTYPIAIAKKLVLEDPDFARNIGALIAADRLRRPQQAITIELLEEMADAGLYEDAKPFLRDEIILGQAVGLYHSEKPNYYAAYTVGKSFRNIPRIVRIQAKAGDYAAAENTMRSVLDFSNIIRIGGTDLATYSLRQSALKKIGIEAAKQAKAKVAEAIIATDLQNPLCHAAVWFALARAAFDAGRKDEALKLYGNGMKAAPDYAAMLLPPFMDVWKHVDIVIERAALERGLGLEAAFAVTAALADRLTADMQMHAVSHEQKPAAKMIAARIAELKGSAAGAAPSASAKDMDSFIASLNLKADLSSREPLRKMALEFLSKGEKDKARAIALYGLKEAEQRKGSGNAKGVAEVMMYYVDIIAQTGEKPDPKALKALEPAIRTAENIIINKRDLDIFRETKREPGVPPEPVSGQDYVAMGEKALAEINEVKSAQKLPGGKAGLEEAIRLGLLRRATDEDLKDWRRLVTGGQNEDIDQVSMQIPNMLLRSAYVVLKPFECPADLAGANAVLFIVPKGGRVPVGYTGHSAVLDMNTGECGGPICRRPMR